MWVNSRGFVTFGKSNAFALLAEPKDACALRGLRGSKINRAVQLSIYQNFGCIRANLTKNTPIMGTDTHPKSTQKGETIGVA